MKKVQKEFQELLFTKTEGRMLEQLTVSYHKSTCVLAITSSLIIMTFYMYVHWFT